MLTGWALRSIITTSRQMPDLKSILKEYETFIPRYCRMLSEKVDLAYKDFFRRVDEIRQGKRLKAEFPIFKLAGRYRPIAYPQSGFGIMANGHLKLSKIGRIRMFKHHKSEAANLADAVDRELFYLCKR